jgi:transcriptional regulator with XRE-family HTH domain
MSELDQASIRARILDILRARSISQAALARRAGIDTALLNRKLKGHRPFRTVELEWIAGALGLAAATLVASSAVGSESAIGAERGENTRVGARLAPPDARAEPLARRTLRKG